MKIALEDADIEKIANGVAKLIAKTMGKAAPKGKAAAADDDTGGEGDGEGDGGDGGDFEGAGEGDGGDGEGDGETAPDRDDVKAALTAVSTKFDQDAAMAILKKTGGAAALSKLKEDKFAAVIKACKAKTK